jgi:hypothetical protein
MGRRELPGQHRDHGDAAAQDEEPAPPVSGWIDRAPVVTIRT